MSERQDDGWQGTIVIVILAVISIHLLMITKAIRDLKPAPPVAVQPEAEDWRTMTDEELEAAGWSKVRFPWGTKPLPDEPPPIVLPKELDND